MYKYYIQNMLQSFIFENHINTKSITYLNYFDFNIISTLY